MGTRLFSPDTSFHELVFPPDVRVCSGCGGPLAICCHRHRRLWALRTGATHLVARLVRCEAPACSRFRRLVNPLGEALFAPPYWHMDFETFSWLGHRTFAHHWSLPQLRAELRETHRILLSADALEDYVRRYQTMAACRQLDPIRRRQLYAAHSDLVLTVDGLQPEVGHETLIVVRELRANVVWLCEPLLAPSAQDIVRLLQTVRAQVQDLGLPVTAWISDTEDKLVKAIAAVFPEVPHQYCENHFLRDAAKLVLAEDARLKSELRQKVRGLRSLESLLLSAPVPAPEEPPSLKAKAVVEGALAQHELPSPAPGDASAAPLSPSTAAMPAVATRGELAEASQAAAKTALFPSESKIPAALHVQVWRWYQNRQRPEWMARKLEEQGVSTSSSGVRRLLTRLRLRPPLLTESVSLPEEERVCSRARMPSSARRLPLELAGAPAPQPTVQERAREQVVLDYAAVVRGVLTDNLGGPLHPPGLRMAEVLEELAASLRRCVGEKKGGAPNGRRPNSTAM